MFDLAKLAAIAAAVAAIWFGVHSVIKHFEASGAAKQLAADTIILDQCKADKLTAIAANQSLQADVALMGQQIKEANTAIDRIRASGEFAKAEALKKLKAQQSTLAYLEQDRLAALDRASRYAVTGETCEQTLAKVGTAMRDLAARELRDRPPTDRGSASQGSGRGGQDTGADQVRIGQ